MSDLIRTLVLCGLLSGTQPITIMGLLLVMTGDRPRRNGSAFILGAFVVETALLVGSSVIFGASVTPNSAPGAWFLVVRFVIGVLLVAAGVMLRRPPKRPAPEIPKALERLQSLDARRSFVAGMALADYQGPVLGCCAIASATTTLAGQLGSIAIYTAIASGIPIGLMVLTTRSERAHDRVQATTTWVMRNRRLLASWLALVLGLFVISDATIGLLYR